MFGRFEVKESHQLENTVVRRGGKTATRYVTATKEVSIQNQAGKRSINLNFSIPSKGGGITDISLKIGDGDFRMMMEAMLTSNPKSFIDAYVEISNHIKNMLQARKFTTRDYDGKIREDDLYDDLTANVDPNIKKNAVLFEALSLVTKKTRSTTL